MAGEEVYLEFIPHGSVVKVCAVCARTGTEVSILGPASSGQEALSRTAVRKLRYVMARRARDAERSSGGERRATDRLV